VPGMGGQEVWLVSGGAGGGEGNVFGSGGGVRASFVRALAGGGGQWMEILVWGNGNTGA
jgi:hypothetical protein